MTRQLLRLRFVDGTLSRGARVFSYDQRDKPADLYMDPDLTVVHPNPIEVEEGTFIEAYADGPRVLDIRDMNHSPSLRVEVDLSDYADLDDLP